MVRGLRGPRSSARACTADARTKRPRGDRGASGFGPGGTYGRGSRPSSGRRVLERAIINLLSLSLPPPLREFGQAPDSKERGLEAYAEALDTDPTAACRTQAEEQAAVVPSQGGFRAAPPTPANSPHRCKANPASTQRTDSGNLLSQRRSRVRDGQ